MVLIREIMTKNPFVMDSSATILDAAKKMDDLNVGFLPVRSNQQTAAIGVLTDRDIVVRAIAQGMDVKSTPIANIMTHTVFSVFDDEDVQAASRKMKDQAIRRLLVLNRKSQQIVGVLSLGDLSADLKMDEKLPAETLREISKAKPTAA